MKLIDSKKVKELQEKKIINAIDVGTETDYNKCHIKGAVNVSSAERDFVKKIENLISEKDDAIVLCGQSKSHKDLEGLGKQLDAAGYRNIFHYREGPTEWKNSGLNVQESL